MDRPTTAGIRSRSKNESLVNKRREQILQGAFKLFFRQGYKETKIKEIAEASGLPEGTIYGYISSKDDILHLICVRFAQNWERLSETLAQAGNVSITDGLKICIREYFQICDRGRERNIFFNREIHHFSPEDRRFLLEAQIKVIDFFKELLEKGIKTGEFRIDSPLAVAHNILIIGHDWGRRRWFLGQHFTLKQFTEIQTDLLLKQITAKGKSSGKKKIVASL